MKGYKYLKEGMVAPCMGDFIYELNKQYEVDHIERMSICHYGYHYFKNLGDLFAYTLYYISGAYNSYGIYEIEADGKILYDESENDGKYCSSKIRIIKKLEKEDIWKLIEEDDLVHDERWTVREVVAHHGYGLDVLINDAHWLVRMAVAEQGYGLDILVNDENDCVRGDVARQGYGLDILINDKDSYVREAVVRQGYGLDILINDEDESVRAAVKRYMELD